MEQLQNILNRPMDEIMETIERMTHEDREQVLDLLANIVPSVREARERLRTHEGRELLQQEDPPPLYDGEGWELPLYGDIEDTPPDYFP